MERKIGEIFEYKGEWYQCVEQPKKYDKTVCAICAFQGNGNCELDRCSGTYRSDKKSVIFKKLEKVGEPYKLGKILIQQYQGIAPVVLPEDSECSSIFRVISSINVIEIEIKQTKENMEEKKPKEDDPLTRVVYNYVNGKISDKELIKTIKEMPDEYPYNKHLKTFSLEAAKSGKPVCTRDGHNARIICFDLKNKDYPIVAAIGNDYSEIAFFYTIRGQLIKGNYKSEKDLMMLPEKKEGWVNVYNSLGVVTFSHNPYDTKKEALANAKPKYYVDTVKIEWEE